MFLSCVNQLLAKILKEPPVSLFVYRKPQQEPEAKAKRKSFKSRVDTGPTQGTLTQAQGPRAGCM